MLYLCYEYDVCLSVCLSKTLVDCDQIVQQKMKIGTLYRIGRCPVYPQPKANLDRSILLSGVWKNVEFCTSVASNGSHVVHLSIC